MEELLSDFVQWIGMQPSWGVYLSLFAIAYLENLLPPVPGDLIVVFCGYLAAIGSLNVLGVIALATIGGTAGFMTMYYVGRQLGTQIFDEKRYRWIPRKRLARATEWFSRIGFRLILANRFLSGLRSVISLTVGVSNTEASKTVLFSSLSSLAWVSLLAWLGFQLGENWEVVRHYLSRYGQFMGVVVVLFIAVQFLRYWYSVKEDGTGDGIGS
jgi:membrane protein DedA with SNARE-associated domain